jgi:hypothetical protein
VSKTPFHVELVYDNPLGLWRLQSRHVIDIYNLKQGWLKQGWLKQGWLKQGWLKQGWLYSKHNTLPLRRQLYFWFFGIEVLRATHRHP